MKFRLFLCTAALLAAHSAEAKTVCCTDAKGNMVCDEGVPAACRTRAYREVNSQGITVRTIEAPLTPEQQAKRNAELAKKKEEEKRLAEIEKHDRLLLATYSSLRDIDIARERVLGDQNKLLQQIQTKLDETTKQKQKLENETEFYKKRGLPEPLKQQISSNDKQHKVQQDALAAKQLEIEKLRAKYEEDKKRFIEISGRR